MAKRYRKGASIGVDNGPSGTIGIIWKKKTWFTKTPTVKQQDYVKKKANVTRVDVVAFIRLLQRYKDSHVMFERPMVNPHRFTASKSALRVLEAQLACIDLLNEHGHNLSVIFVDSQEWQKPLLPKGSKGSNLKKASRQVGKRLFPKHKEFIENHKDADGMLIAEWCRRSY
jgi:hypothetical protein